jgi:hypothetical protein
MIIGHLHINSWRGISIGAVHWYADLRVHDKEKELEEKIQLERPYTAKEAAALNAEAKEQGYMSRMYRTGQLTEGFNTEASAIKLGIKTFKTKYPDGILFKGDHCTCSAWKNVIYYPERAANHVLALEMLAKEFQKLNGYECKPHFRQLVETLDKAWYKIYCQLETL